MSYSERSHSNILTGLSDIQNKLLLELPKHTKPYESLRQVCELLLGVNFGGAYYPHILVFASIHVKIDRFRLKGDNLAIDLYCSNKLKPEEFSVSAFGKDSRGDLAFSEKFADFKRMKGEVASSCKQIALPKRGILLR
jgi:hypothetical protein